MSERRRAGRSHTLAGIGDIDPDGRQEITIRDLGGVDADGIAKALQLGDSPTRALTILFGDGRRVAVTVPGDFSGDLGHPVTAALVLDSAARALEKQYEWVLPGVLSKPALVRRVEQKVKEYLASDTAYTGYFNQFLIMFGIVRVVLRDRKLTLLPPSITQFRNCADALVQEYWQHMSAEERREDGIGAYDESTFVLWGAHPEVEGDLQALSYARDIAIYFENILARGPLSSGDEQGLVASGIVTGREFVTMMEQRVCRDEWYESWLVKAHSLLNEQILEITTPRWER